MVGFRVLGERREKERLIPQIVAYLSCSAGRTHFAQTNKKPRMTEVGKDEKTRLKKRRIEKSGLKSRRTTPTKK